MAEINVVNVELGQTDWLAWLRFRKKTILLVEDSPNDVEQIRVAAEHEGFELVTASTAEQALGILHENGRKFILAMVDVGLPRMDGWTFRRIAGERWPNLRVWMISGTENALEHLPSGIPITMLWKSSEYHAAFRELKRIIS